MKRFCAILISVLLLCSVSMSAMAAGTDSIIIKPNLPDGFVGTITYNAYKIFDIVEIENQEVYSIANDSKFIDCITEENGFSVADGTNNNYFVSFDGSKSGPELAAIFNAVADKGAAVTAESIRGADAELNGLDHGYYLITSSLGTAIFLQTSGTGTAIVVDEKNSLPTISKTADLTSTDMGVKITYTLTVTIPATIPTGDITVHDFNSNLKDFELNVTESSNGVQPHNEHCAKCNLEFIIPYTQSNAEQSFRIVYNAVIDIAHTATAGVEAKNEAWLSFKRGNEILNSLHTDEVKAHSTVVKVTAVDTPVDEDTAPTPLKDAEFVLKNSAGKYYSITESGVAWVNDIGSATNQTSGADGLLYFPGLADGTYTLVEVSAPIGYNKAADTSFTIEGTEANHTHELKVEHQKGSALPDTGGIGTTIFYIVGGVLMATALVILLARKYVNNERKDK